MTVSYDHFDELAYRANDGIEVSLLWRKTDGAIALVVYDARGGEAFERAVPREKALDAFHHPFAYVGG